MEVELSGLITLNHKSHNSFSTRSNEKTNETDSTQGNENAEDATINAIERELIIKNLSLSLVSLGMKDME